MRVSEPRPLAGSGAPRNADAPPDSADSTNATRLTWALVGPAQTPPATYGAVETLVWDYKIYLEKLGHTAAIINTPHPREARAELNRIRPDIVHQHNLSCLKAIRPPPPTYYFYQPQRVGCDDPPARLQLYPQAFALLS